MNLRNTLAAVLLATVVPLAAACGTNAEAALTTATSSSGTNSTTESTTATTPSGTSSTSVDTGSRPGRGAQGGGPGGSVEASSVTTEEQLVALIQEAYGDAGLGLHRGHQPVQDVLDEVLTITHDELHVRMEAGQNLAAIAEDIGVDPQTLVDALVESWSPAINQLLAAGTLTQDAADQYRAALQEAFTFRITWDGEQETPTFTGLAT